MNKKFMVSRLSLSTLSGLTGILLMASCNKLTDIPPSPAPPTPPGARNPALGMSSSNPVGTLQVYTLAGNGTAAWLEGTVSTAEFSSPAAVATDLAGNTYVADAANNRIRKITQAGVTSTLAGTGVAGYKDGPGSSAQFSNPTGIAVDLLGNVFVADRNNNRIRKITPDGNVNLLAGTGNAGFTDGGDSSAQFSSPAGVAIDASGNVYVTDVVNERIRKITTTGLVTTLAGNGNTGADNGPGGFAATFNHPIGIAVDGSGIVYVADSGNNQIRKITPDRLVSLLTGSPDANPGNTDGAPAMATFNSPTGLVINSVGNIYVADKGNNRIRLVTPAGVVSPLAGDPNGNPGFVDGLPDAAQFKAPTGVAVDTSGNIFIADQGNQRIREMSITVIVTTLAGNGIGGAVVNGAPLIFPDGIAMGPSGSVYVSNGRIAQIVQISLSTGFVSGIAGGTGAIGFLDGPASTALFAWPVGMATDAAGNIYVGDEPNNRVRKLAPAPAPVLWNVSTLAGNGVEGFADGPAASASFDLPDHLAVDAAGNVYVSDGFNNRIRKITPAGIVSTVAGGTDANYRDGQGTAARFNWPGGITLDPAGNLYVADYNNNRIRKITPAGDVSTIAGTGETGVRNGPAASAQFSGPDALAFDASGNLYISELGTNDIRILTPSGTVSTLAGGSAEGYLNGVGRFAKFDLPVEMVIDVDGTIYVVEESNHTVRKIK